MKITKLLAVLFLALASSTWTANAAVDAFLKVDGITGESVSKGHEGQIDVLSWSWGVSNSGSFAAGGGGGAGKASFQDLSITKYVDVASTSLLEACATGRHIKEAVLTVAKSSGDTTVDFYVITLEDVLVSSVSQGAGGGNRPMESISLNYRKVSVRYLTQTKKGSDSSAPVFTYDLAAHSTQ